MSTGVSEALRDLARALDGIGEGWYLFGAQAALLRGSRRLTSDIDVTVLAGDQPADVIVARLVQEGLVLRVPDVADFVKHTRVLPMVHRRTTMPVDVVLGGPGLEALFLESAEPVTLGGVPILVPTTEHLIVMKLLAARPKDFEDAVAMARAAEVDLVAVDRLIDAIATGLGEDDVRVALTEFRRRLPFTVP